MTPISELIDFLKENQGSLGLDAQRVNSLVVPPSILDTTKLGVFADSPENKVELWLTNAMVLAAWVKPALSFNPDTQEYHLCVGAVHKLELFFYNTSKDISNCNYFAIILDKSPIEKRICAKKATNDLINQAYLSEKDNENIDSSFVKNVCTSLSVYSLSAKFMPLIKYVGLDPNAATVPLLNTTLFDIDTFRKVKWRVTADKWGQHQSQVDLFKDKFQEEGAIIKIQQLGCWVIDYEEVEELHHTLSLYRFDSTYIVEVISLTKKLKRPKYSLITLKTFSNSLVSEQDTINVITNKILSQFEVLLSP